mgnify:CR=1 FL=1
MNDRVNHRIECEVLGRSDRAHLLCVSQQHMQEFVAEDGLDLVVVAALLLDEIQVDQQCRPVLTRHGERRHLVAEADFADPQHRSDGEGVLVDEFLYETSQAFRTHA